MTAGVLRVWATSHGTGEDAAALVTMQLRYPRCIHAQVLTHRVFSRNAASNRARPVSVALRDVVDNEWVPAWRLRAERGMQPAAADVPAETARQATALWRAARIAAFDAAARLADLRIAKELVNRLLEPFQLIDVVMTGTVGAWETFVEVRSHDTAQGEIRHLALAVAEALHKLDFGSMGCGRHMPYVDAQETVVLNEVDVTEAVAVARCARVSYRPFEAIGAADVEADTRLFLKLVRARPMHASPLEHVARAVPSNVGQLHRGWLTLRHDASWLADVIGRAERAIGGVEG